MPHDRKNKVSESRHTSEISVEDKSAIWDFSVSKKSGCISVREGLKSLHHEAIRLRCSLTPIACSALSPISPSRVLPAYPMVRYFSPRAPCHSSQSDLTSKDQCPLHVPQI